MKFFSTSVLVALTHGEVEVEDSSLLQHKSKVWTEDQIGVAISRATSDLPRATDATDAEVDEMVHAFSQDLMTTSTVLMQSSISQKDALLRRASQSAEVSSFFEGYANLPQETKYKVVNSALGSEDLINVFQTMPEQDRRALLVQLDGSHMDRTVGQKTKTETKRTEDAVGNKKTETVTTRDGKVVHRHAHVHNARTGQTETATQSKQHSHRHAHNSKSGQTSTETKSAGHSHKHVHNAKSGQTSTETKSRFGQSHSHVHNAKSGQTQTVSTGANGYRHSHSHTHTHKGGKSYTDTATETTAHSGADKVGHSHSHYHDGRSTVTNTVSRDGNKFSGHSHSHDGRTHKTHSGRTGTGTGGTGTGSHHDHDDHDDHDHSDGKKGKKGK